MKMPRVSVQTIMALVVVVAADCMACRALFSRPGAMTAHINLIFFNSLPMVNLIAISVAFWIRGRLGSFWAGFTCFGLIALIVSNLCLMPILEWWEKTLTAAGLEAWVGDSEIRELIIRYGLLTALLAFPQLLFACFGGALVRLIGKTLPTDVSPRRQMAALGTMVVLVVLPALCVDPYLRLTVDRKLSRLGGSEAVVIDEQVQRLMAIAAPPAPGMSATFAIGAKSAVAKGTRVRVELDDESSIIQGIQDSRGGEPSFGDYRIVRTTLLDGDRQGQEIALPRCALVPTRK
jgi:hypothetical protein